MSGKAIRCLIPLMILCSVGGGNIQGVEKPRILMGVGFAETLNAGLKFRTGEKTQMGISVGTWPSPGGYIFDWNSLISLSGDFYYHFGGHAYDALWILVNALKKVGDDPAKLRDEIEKTEFVGTAGIFKFSPTDHCGLDKTAFELLTVKGGKFVVLKE